MECRDTGTLTRRFPPYAASVGWYMAALRSMARGEPGPGAPWRHPNRTLIAGPSGMQTLSVPVAGSASALKSHTRAPLLISGHGGWPRRHLAALDAAYGRTPFWPHYSPLLADILLDPGPTLDALCRSIHLMVSHAIGLDETARGIGQGSLGLYVPANPRPWPRHRPLPAATDPAALSILDLLFCRGPEAILTLTAPTRQYPGRDGVI